jgi:hypothetical protein
MGERSTVDRIRWCEQIRLSDPKDDSTTSRGIGGSGSTLVVIASTRGVIERKTRKDIDISEQRELSASRVEVVVPEHAD